MKSKIYTHENTQQVYNLHRVAIEELTKTTTVKEQLTAFANNLFAAWQARNPVCKAQINNWHPDYIGKSLDIIFQAPFQLADARLSIAKDCGFLDWMEVEKKGPVRFNLSFEKAIDTLLAGDLVNLKKQIERQPTLLHTRSTYGHRATLLHYAGSNGLEMWRQKVPYNLPKIVQFLIAVGADKNATMRVYGGEHTTLEMAVSSAHPREAGILEELVEVLQ